MVLPEVFDTKVALNRHIAVHKGNKMIPMQTAKCNIM